MTTVSVDDATFDDLDWSFHSFEVVASGALTGLRFTDAVVDAGFLSAYLDGVVIEPIPLPATLMLLLTELTTIMPLARRRA